MVEIFSFIILNIPDISILTSKFLLKVMVGVPLYATNYFSLAAFKILFLFLNFDNLIMCLGVGLFDLSY